MSFQLSTGSAKGWGASLPCLAAIFLVGSLTDASCAETSLDISKATETKHAGLAGGPLHVYVGNVNLPADGTWQLSAPQTLSTVQELYLLPTESSRIRQLGKRMFAALQQRQIRNGQWQLQMGYDACRQYAQEHGGIGPKSLADLEGDKRWNYVVERWGKVHWGIRELSDLTDESPTTGPFIHLIPKTHFRLSESKMEARPNSETAPRLVVRKQDREILAFELRPFIGDGLQWVLYTDGQCERVEVDNELVASQGVAIRPIINHDPGKTQKQTKNANYRIVMVARKPVTEQVHLTAHSQVIKQPIQVQWELGESDTVEYAEVESPLSSARKYAWKPYLQSAGGGVLQTWDRSDNATLTGDPPRNLSMFSVLGGRAAVEETLQLQSLNVTDSNEEATIDIDSLQGVKVKSHPFDEMLGDQPGGNLDLARYVPTDRLFIHIGKPESIPAMLDSGAPFIASLGTALTGNCLQYNLESRYLERLGMSRDWVDNVLTSGLTSEMAISAPDLFFIDGTDLTIVAKLRHPTLLRQLVGMLGAEGLTDESILELPTQSGDSAFLALRDDLLFASTNRAEIEQSIELHQRQGEGSLGESTEFRYMLTQLEVTEDTRFYSYLSDPFVRRLVSPHVKIAQRRRVLEKAKLETLSASWLRARLDGRDEIQSLPDSVHNRYLPKDWDYGGTSIDSSGVVRSEHYGRLPRMKTLPEVPLKNVTPAEAEAYKEYLENYSRYWRRFFDPIAIRLDEVGPDQLELSTFILPLVDNSIYNGLRSVLAHQDDQTPLLVPTVEPAPVIQFSANLKENAWAQVAGNFSEFFTRYSGASSAMLDDFGPSLHVAIFDADPIIAMGSGDIFGAFGGNVLRGGGDQMVMLPIALSMLTRPCSILVETKAPEKTSQYLRQASLTGLGNRRTGRGFRSSFYQVGDRDEWVWNMDIFGVVKLRYGVEVVGNYMVIRNIPWSSEDRVVNVAPAELNAAILQANPSACELQMPGLFAAAADGNRTAVMSGLGRLYPFMLSGSGSVEKAMSEHQRMFGFHPRMFGKDQWQWKDFRLASDEYGEPAQQRQPAFDPDEPFGLMNRIDNLKLNMQFEQDGLRSTIRWSLR